jgi:exodeoxyribonuclease VII large subunit
MPTASQPVKIFTISQINAQIHELLEASFPELWVEGEISNWRAYPSGHNYFTLKDAEAEAKAVLFRGNAAGLKFKPQDGLKVLARVRVSSYVKRGDLQLIVAAMEPRDVGALELALRQLKEKLAQEGLFDEERKRPIPEHARKIGILTSLQGAAVHDMLTVLKSRWDGLDIKILPVTVQGPGAKESIAQGIADFNRCFPDTEVLLVGRGGGSIEDLWAFNEEVVARAIAASKIPVISCVGHETDFTVADLVADVRAPTPSAAAVLAVSDKSVLLEKIENAHDALAFFINEKLKGLAQRVEFARRHPFLQSPRRLYEQRVQRVDELTLRLPEAMKRRLDSAERDLRHLSAQLDAFSPLKVLGRGYAVAQKEPSGEIIRSSGQVRKGDAIRVRVEKGRLTCEVLETHEQ